MIIIGNTLVSEDIFEAQFICNLYACKGACCIEGDAGAPLLAEEVDLIKNDFETIKPFLTPEFVNSIEKTNFYEADKDGDWVTTCQKTGECNFVVKSKDGTLSCGIELAHKAGKTTFKKPLSCHLYPIRLSKVGEYTALNYHRWHICHAACSFGKQEQVTLFEFLKEPLIRAFGNHWYAEATEIAKAYKQSFNHANNR